MSLLDKAQACIEMSQELLYRGDNAGSLECALEAAKYLQLIRLLRQDVVLNDDSKHQTQQPSAPGRDFSGNGSLN
jgi:hypothetical protein